MLETLLLTYYLHQFQYQAPYRTDRTAEYVQSVEPRGSLAVTATLLGSASIPPGAQRVPMMHLTMGAGCDAPVTVESISLQRKGLGSHTDIDAVYALHRHQRISRARTISQKNGMVTLRTRRFTIPACHTEEVTIAVDIAEEASPASEHRLELSHEGLVTDAARVSVQRRRDNGIRRTAGRAVGQVALEFLQLNKRVRYGTNQEVSRFTLEADSRDDHLLHAITLVNKGSASDDDLQNLAVAFRHRHVSTVAPSLTGDRVRLTFDPPLLLKKNKKRTFSLRADVRASRSRTIRFLIEEEGDIEAEPLRGRHR